MTVPTRTAFIFSRLDYCNAVLYGLPHSTINPLQHVKNITSRVTLSQSARDDVRPALKELHWLPVTYQIQYKVALLMYMVHANRCPQYLRDSVVSASCEPGRHHLRSATNLNYILPRTRTKFGEKAFSVSGPIVWNSLPLSVRLSPTLTGSKRNLKLRF